MSAAARLNYQVSLDKLNFAKAVLVEVYNREHGANLSVSELSTSQIVAALIGYLRNSQPYQERIGQKIGESPGLQFTKKRSRPSQNKVAVIKTIELTLYSTMANHFPEALWRAYLDCGDKSMRSLNAIVAKARLGVEEVLEDMAQRAARGEYDGQTTNSARYPQPRKTRKQKAQQGSQN